MIDLLLGNKEFDDIQTQYKTQFLSSAVLSSKNDDNIKAALVRKIHIEQLFGWINQPPPLPKVGLTNIKKVFLNVMSVRIKTVCFLILKRDNVHFF